MSDLPIPEPAGFRELSKQEKVRYLQSLWDAIVDSPEELPVRASHLDLAEERLAAYRQEPAQSGSAYELLDRLGKKKR